MLAVNRALAAVIRQTLPAELVEANQELREITQQLIDDQTLVLSAMGASQCIDCDKFCLDRDLGYCEKCNERVCNECNACTLCFETYCGKHWRTHFRVCIECGDWLCPIDLHHKCPWK